MRVLFDMVDTAHVHFFKQLIFELKKRGADVLVTARRKDITVELLEKLGIEYRCISTMGKGLLGMAWELFVRDIRLLGVARKFRPDVMMAKNAGVSIGIVGALMGVPRLVLEDTEHARLQRLVGLPFATCIITGTGYLKDHGRRQKKFDGVWVQAYLDERFFRPDAELIRKYGVDPDRPYIVLRTVAWEAAHDAGHEGIGDGGLQAAVERLERFGRVLICSEKPLPEGLCKYANPVPVEHIHHLLAFAQLYLGEGGSMTAEAAFMGTPAIFCSPLRVGYLVALEDQYDMVYNVDTMAEALPVAEELLGREDLKSQWLKKRQRLLAASDDVVEFILQTIEEAGGQ